MYVHNHINFSTDEIEVKMTPSKGKQTIWITCDKAMLELTLNDKQVEMLRPIIHWTEKELDEYSNSGSKVSA